MSQHCTGCKFWSDLVAEGSLKHEPWVVALCLHPDASPNEMVWKRCSEYEKGEPIDSPEPRYGDLDDELDKIWESLESGPMYGGRMQPDETVVANLAALPDDEEGRKR